MKGDETENKKIGCTVNLMVKMFPLSLCDAVQCVKAGMGKASVSGKGIQALGKESRTRGVVRIPWRPVVQLST